MSKQMAIISKTELTDRFL